MVEVDELVKAAQRAVREAASSERVTTGHGTRASRKRTTSDCDRTHRGSPSHAKHTACQHATGSPQMWSSSHRLAIRQQDNALLTVRMRRHLQDVEEATPFSLYVAPRMEDVAAVMALLSEVKGGPLSGKCRLGA